MFPTLSYLIHYLFGLNVPVPIPTFGFFMALAFWGAYWTWTTEFKRKAALGLIPPVRVSRLMDQLLLYCGIFGFIGAIGLAKLENTSGFIRHPLHWLTTYNGLVYYGGLIFGAVTYLYIMRRNGIPLAAGADTGTPGMMLAYGIGRIGCQLSGDGDWGIVNLRPLPRWLSWAPEGIWASRFPHNVIHQGVYIPGCAGPYCTELLNPVFPTSLYEAVACLLLFGLLWWLRRRITQAGLLFSVYALLIGTERFLIEFIRVNPVHSLLGLALSQAQFISLGWIGIGLVSFWYNKRAN